MYPIVFRASDLGVKVAENRYFSLTIQCARGTIWVIGGWVMKRLLRLHLFDCMESNSNLKFRG